MRVFLSILVSLTLIFASSCNKEDGVKPLGCIDGCADSSMELQTTLHYFMGTDLKSYYYTNISDMESAVAAGALGCNGKFYYLFPSSSSEATLYRIDYTFEDQVDGSESVVVRSYTDFPSIAAESLQMVIADVVEDSGHNKLYPDHRMNLIIGSHGMAWELVEEPTASYAASKSGVQRVMTAAEESERGHPGVENQAIPTRYMGLASKVSEGAIDIEDLCTAISNSDEKFGYIIFDACFMSSIEVFYRLRNCCDYIVASPAEVMAAGFPFETIIPHLFTDNGRDFDLTAACEAFYTFYTTYSTKSATVAMCVTSELEALASVIANMELRSLTSNEIKGIQAYERYSYHKFYDLGEYITTASDGNTEAAAAFQAQFDKTFPESCRLHTPTFYSSVSGSGSNTISIDYYSGVTTSEPSSNGYCYGWELEPWSIAAGRTE
ncbi:MAG: clostripain-related cysteine peptidase [Rikenellaceae bacterium]